MTQQTDKQAGTEMDITTYRLIQPRGLSSENSKIKYDNTNKLDGVGPVDNRPFTE